MTIDMGRFHQVFFDEAGEHLAAMEALLLELDVEAPDLEVLHAIFRAAHSIKGGAGTFGFADMAQVTHVLETLLEGLRNQQTAPTVEMIDLLLETGDLLKAQLAAHQEGVDLEDPRVELVCARIEQLSRIDPAADSVTLRRMPPGATAQQWRIEFRPDQLLREPDGDLSALWDALGDLGQTERLAEDSPQLAVWRLTTQMGREAVTETFAFVCDPRLVRIEADPEISVPGIQGETNQGESQDAVAPADKEEDSGFGFFADAPGSERVLDQEHDGFGLFGASPGMDQVAAIAARDQDEAEQGFGFFDSAPGTPDAAMGRDSPPDAEPDPAPARAGTALAPGADSTPKRRAAPESSIRVGVEKVDQLINLVGELVITHAMLAESTSILDPVAHERMFDGLGNLERNSRDLQQAVMSIRMVPISFVFSRFPRVVRDTAAALGKRVTLNLVGEDTELDKGLIERLVDPLNHLVRNSIDHGIETPERRREAGKSEQGEIVLAASHRGGNVVVEVSDDGAGLNRDRLLAKAAERGLVLSENPSDKEVWQLVFAAGFSTAERVTDISGRGVGMDVVRRNIEGMNGRVEIDSQPGRGTRITIRLPLTLAILDGMSVRVGEEVFILPLTVIRESIRPQREQYKTLAGKGQVVQVSDEYLPLVVLHALFRLEEQQTRPEEGIVVIVDTNEGRAALQVAELLAQHQVVIKSLETNYRKVEGISGATIMGDGRVAMILDVDALVRMSRQRA